MRLADEDVKAGLLCARYPRGVPAELADVIAHRFAARCEVDGAVVRAVLELDGVAYRATLQLAPGVVEIDLPHIDRFELHVRWSDRHAGEAAPRADDFDDSCLVETNDLALAASWLDRQARAALLAARYVSHAGPGTTALLVRDNRWEHALGGSKATARRAGAEASRERLVDMLDATLVLAARPVRWARSFAPLARALGGEVAARVELGGRPVLRVRRGPTEVTLRLLRRFGVGDRGRLRAVIGAHRHGSAGDTLALVADDLPRAAQPPPLAQGAPALALDTRARSLIDAARPSSALVRAHDVEITFDGADADHARLGAAIELAAHWASPAPAGPYR